MQYRLKQAFLGFLECMGCPVLNVFHLFLRHDLISSMYMYNLDGVGISSRMFEKVSIQSQPL